VGREVWLLPKHLRQIGDFLDLYPAEVPAEIGVTK
jgi:hypothetical protein